MKKSLVPGAIEVHFTVTQEDDLNAERCRKESGKHPLLIWTGLDPGDMVSMRALGNRCYVGTVEQRTKDGLMIWIRDDLNERKLFHFRDCQCVVLIAPIHADSRPSRLGGNAEDRSQDSIRL